MKLDCLLESERKCKNNGDDECECEHSSKMKTTVSPMTSGSGAHWSRWGKQPIRRPKPTLSFDPVDYEDGFED